jgi:hypothetical protein
VARRGSRGNFARALKEIGDAATEEAKKALAEGAEFVVWEAVSNIHNVSGDLAASIRAIPMNNGAKIRIVADAEDKNGVEYGQYVEFWPGREHPFLYPAMDAHRDQIKRRVADAIKEAVRKNAAK